MKELICQLIKKSIIVAIVVSVLLFVSYQMRPEFDQSDLYEVSGTCIEIHKTPIGKHGTMYHAEMDNGNIYFVMGDLREHFGVSVRDLEGQYLEICVAERLFFSPEIIALSHSAEDKEHSLDLINQLNFKARIIITIIFLFFGFVFLSA